MSANAPLPAPTDVTITLSPATHSPTGNETLRLAGHTEVPGYEILDEIGRGGMGVVYKARHQQLKRLVALKMILSGSHAADAERDRFRREAEAVAQLSHPNIVQIHEVGECGGLPFMALEYCEGGGLDRHLRGQPLPPRDAATLVATLAEAMAAVHQLGVIHRDLKPANVLLTACGEREAIQPQTATPKITDFGLAKKLDDGGNTRTGNVVGTPSYMAPEQAEGKKEIGPLADVYALGAILYECLTGRPPFAGPTALDTIVQVIAEDPVSPRVLQPGCPRDLETACLKCLRKSPGQRYTSAHALAEDLNRFLEGRPLHARPAGNIERAFKWMRRKPTAACLLLVSLAAAVVLGMFWVDYHAQLTEQREKAQLRRQDALERSSEAKDAREKAQLASEDAEQQLRHAEAEERLADFNKAEAIVQRSRIRNSLYNSQLQRAVSSARSPGLVRHLLDDKTVCPEELRDFAWYSLDRKCRLQHLRFDTHTDGLASMALASDSQTLFTLDTLDGKVISWNLQTGERLREWPHPIKVVSMSLASEAGILATAGTDGKVRLWDTTSGKQLPDLKTDRVGGVRFSNDGRVLITSHTDAMVQNWDLKTGKSIELKVTFLDKGHFKSDPKKSAFIQALTVSPDGTWVAGSYYPIKDKVPGFCVKTSGGSIDPKRTRDVGFLPGISYIPIALAVAFSPTENLVAATNTDQADRIIYLGVPGRYVSNSQVRKILGHGGLIRCLAFSPDGRSLASGCDDGIVRVFDVASSKEQFRFTEQGQTFHAVDFTADGRTLLAGTASGKVLTWNLMPPREYQALRGIVGKVAKVGFSAKDDSLEAIVEPPGKPTERTLRSWNLESGLEQVARTATGATATTSLEVRSSDDKLIATVEKYDRIHLRDATDGKTRHVIESKAGRINALAFSNDSKTLASGGEDRLIRLWDTASGQSRGNLAGSESPVQALAFRADSRTLVSADGSMVRVWGQPLRLPSQEPFVVVDGQGQEKSQFETLHQAILKARPEDAVEIKVNGVLHVPPLRVNGKPLTLRAGKGYRPVLQLIFDSQTPPDWLITCDSSLTLQDLELQTISKDSLDRRVPGNLRVNKGKLLATNCRFVTKGETLNVSVGASSATEFRACEFSSDRWHNLTWDPKGEDRLVLSGCLFSSPISVNFDAKARPQKSTRLIISGNTFRSFLAIELRLLVPPVQPSTEPPLHVEATDNIFAVSYVLLFNQYQANPLDGAEAETLLRQLMQWQDHRNVFGSSQYLSRLVQWKAAPTQSAVKNLVDWRKFWGSEDKASVEGKLQFNSNGQLPPGSLGQGLGADPTRVGPGAVNEKGKER